MAAEVLGAGDKVIKDAHDTFETVDRGQLIKTPGHGGMAPNDFANIESESVLHLGNDGGCPARCVEIGLTGHKGNGLEVSALPIVVPLPVGFRVGRTGDDEIQRLGPDVPPGLLRMSQQTPGIGSCSFEIVITNDELIVTVLRAKAHTPV